MEYDLEKITDPMMISQFGIVRTPALAIDGKIKSMGRVPDVAEITTILATWFQTEVKLDLPNGSNPCSTR